MVVEHTSAPSVTQDTPPVVSNRHVSAIGDRSVLEQQTDSLLDRTLRNVQDRRNEIAHALGHNGEARQTNPTGGSLAREGG